MGGQMGGMPAQQQNTGGQLPPGFSQLYSAGGGPVTPKGMLSPGDEGGGSGPGEGPFPTGGYDPDRHDVDSPLDPGGGGDPTAQNDPVGGGRGPAAPAGPPGPSWTNSNEPWYVPNMPIAPWGGDPSKPPVFTPENWGPSYTPWAPGGQSQIPWGTATGGGDWRNNMQPPPPGQGLPPWMGGPPPGGGGGGGGGPLVPKGPGGPGYQGPTQIGPTEGDFGPPYGPGGQQPQVQPPVSVYDTYASGKAMMDETLDQALGGAIAGAGFGGNRYGTAAANAAGRVGADAAAQLNNQFTNMLYNQGNQDLNRQLQATGMGLQNQLAMEQLKAGNLNQGFDRLLRGGQLGMQQGQMQEDQIAKRLQMLLGAGQQETGRQDQWDMASYQNYINQMWAPLQNMSAFMGGPGPVRNEPIVTQTGGSAGAADYLGAAAPIIAAAIMASDERLKENIQDTGVKVGPLNLKTWNWERSGAPGVGFIAQDVEKVFPEAVLEVPAGTKLIDTARLVNGLQMGAA